MKRFLAYLSILISVILGVVIVAKPAVQGINGGYDYKEYKEYLYQIVNHGSTVDDFEELVEDEEGKAVADIAKEFENRLLSYDVEKYDIVTEGNDKIRVRFAAPEGQYQRIANYLRFDGNLSLVTHDGEVVFNNFVDETSDDQTVMFGKQKAYITYANNIVPGIVIPLEDPKLFEEKAVIHAEEENVPNEETGEDVSNEGRIYLWSNYDKNVDNLDAANKNENIKEKLLIDFAYNSLWFEENEEDHKSLVYYIPVEGLTEETDVSNIPWAAVTQATEAAKYLLHLVNASHYDYRIIPLEERTIPANLETIVQLDEGKTIAASSTLIATVVSFAIIAIVLVFVTRLSGLTTVLVSAFGMLLTLLFYNGVGATFGFPVLLGFIVVSIMMLLSSAIYSYKITQEIKKGKAVKRAVADASKKHVWYTLDVSIIALLTGIIIYSLGNSYLSGLGIMLFFGALVNLVLQLIVNRVALNFLATSSIGNKNYKLFRMGIKEEAPNAEEVKETATEEVKEEPKALKTPRRSIAFGAIVGLLTLACALGLGISSIVSTPYVEASTNKNLSSNVYLYISDDYTEYSNKPDAVVKVLEDIRFVVETEKDGVTTTNYEKVYTKITTIQYTGYTNPTAVEDSIPFIYSIYEVAIPENIMKNANEESFVFGKVSTVDDKEVFTPEAGNTRYTLTSGIETYFVEKTSVDNINLTINEVKQHDLTKTYNLGTIALVTFISILVSSVYLFVRHGRHVGLLALGTSAAFATIVLGFFSIVRTAQYNYVAYAAIPVAILLLIMVAFGAVTYKEHLNEVKIKNMDSKYRIEVAKKAENDIKTTFAFVEMCSLVYFFAFYGFSGMATANALFVTFLVLVVAYFFLSIVFVPYLIKLIDKFGDLDLKIKPAKNSKKRLKQQHKLKQRGKEVEEATFIGIND